MPCRELRFCLWYFMWSTKIRKTAFAQKVAEAKRKPPGSLVMQEAPGVLFYFAA